MILRLEHSKSILRQTISQSTSNLFLKKTIHLLNQSELDKIFDYLENLQIRIVEPYERYKNEQRKRIARTFRSPYPEIARQRERKGQKYLLKKGYPLELVEHGIVEPSPSVRNNELLPSHLKYGPHKPNLVSHPSEEYPPNFAVRELFPTESLYLSSNSENENNENPPVAPVVAPVVAPSVAPVENGVNDPTQEATQGGKRRNKKSNK